MKELFYAKSNNGLLEFSNKKELNDFLVKHNGKTFIVNIARETGRRTETQSRALHRYFSLLAVALNDAGLTVQEVLKKKVELEWTPLRVKENLWRDIQFRLFGKNSTKDLDKVSEITLVYETLNRHLGEKFQLESIPFPNNSNKIK